MYSIHSPVDGQTQFSAKKIWGKTDGRNSMAEARRKPGENQNPYLIIKLIRVHHKNGCVGYQIIY